MKKILIFIITIFHSFNLFPWTVTVHNNSNEPIRAEINSTQSYPCGVWYAGCMDSWCSCSKTIDVPAKQTREYNYADGPRSCSADYICAGACTSSIVIYNSKGVRVTDQAKLVGGLTACSNVDVNVGKGSDGNWYIYTTDWTNKFVNFITEKIEPALTVGFQFSKLIPNAQQAAENGGKIEDSINNFTKQIDVPNNTIKELMIQVSNEGNSINDFIKKTTVTIENFKKNIPIIIKGDLIGALTALDQIEKIKTSMKEAENLLVKVKNSFDTIIKQVNNLNLRPIVEALINLVTIIKNLIGNIKNIISSLPNDVVSNSIVGPLGSTENNLNILINQLKTLLDEKYLTISEISINFINGAASNIQEAPNLVTNITNSINKIISDVNKLTGTIVPKLKNNINKLNETISGTANKPNIKDRLINTIKKDYIGELIGIALGTSIAAYFSAGTLTTIALFGMMKPIIKNILKPILQEIGLNDFVGAAKELMITVKGDIDETIKIINNLNKYGIKTIPDKSATILVEVQKTADNLVKDINAVYNEVPSITGIKNS